MVEIIIVGIACLIVGYLVGSRKKQIQIIETHDDCQLECVCYDRGRDRGYDTGWDAGKSTIKPEKKIVNTVLRKEPVKLVRHTVQQTRLKNLEKARQVRKDNLARVEEIKQTRLNNLKKARRSKRRGMR